MAVYVDQLKYYSKRGIRSGYWCHLFADTVEELHDFASKIKLMSVWFQDKSYPHYDVTKNIRRLAITNGAVEITTKEYLQGIKCVKN